MSDLNDQLDRWDAETTQHNARGFSAESRLMYWLGISPAGLSQAMIEELFQSKEDTTLALAGAVKHQWAYWSEQDQVWKPAKEHLSGQWENAKD